MYSLSLSVVTGDTSALADPVALFLVQLILIVGMSKVLAYFCKYIKQPTVIAVLEVITGVLLGPSAFGHIPKFTATIFPPASIAVLNIIANIGLILFMFMVGLEVDTRIVKKNLTSALVISLTAIILPFVLGIGSSYTIYTIESPKVKFASFLLFVGTAMAITAMPVLGRILSEYGLIESRIGNLALSSAAVDDVIAWCVLATVVAIAKANSGIEALWAFMLLIGFFAFMMFVVRPLLASIAKRRAETILSYQATVVILLAIFVCAWITLTIGVHSIFGPFVMGVVIPRRNGFAARVIERIEDLVLIIFIPFFFTYSGLNTNIGLLNDGTSWGLVFLVIATACVGKITGATVAARILGNNWKDSASVGVLMNCKGLIELIVLNVGLQSGVLNQKVFTIFVVMALVTTFITSPLVSVLVKKRKSEGKEGSDIFTVFLGLYNLKSAPLLIAISNLFTTASDNFLVKALMFQEITDRPSTYYFSEIYNYVQDAPVGKNRKRLLSNFRSNLKSSNSADIQVKTLSSCNLVRDVLAYSVTHFSDIFLFNILYSLEDAPEEFKLTASISSLDRHFDKVVKYDPISEVINACIKRSSSAIGVLAYKFELHELNIRKLLVVCTGNTEDQSFMVPLRKFPTSISITLLTTDVTEETKDTLQVITTGTPEKAAIEEAQKDSYDLIILVSNRKKAIFSSPVLQAVDIPVLIYYPEAAANRSTKFQELEITDQHVEQTV